MDRLIELLSIPLLTGLIITVLLLAVTALWLMELDYHRALATRQSEFLEFVEDLSYWREEERQYYQWRLGDLAGRIDDLATRELGEGAAAADHRVLEEALSNVSDRMNRSIVADKLALKREGLLASNWKIPSIW